MQQLCSVSLDQLMTTIEQAAETNRTIELPTDTPELVIRVFSTRSIVLIKDGTTLMRFKCQLMDVDSQEIKAERTTNGSVRFWHAQLLKAVNQGAVNAVFSSV